MPPIEALIFAVVAAGTLVLAVTVVVVIVGIRHEERDLTMTRRAAPSPAARLTRRIVGLYVRKTDPETACAARPEQQARWYQGCR
jgi:hypothetical protein